MGRSPCCEKEHTNKGAWTKEEDQLLVNYIRLHGEGCWRSLPKAAGLSRCGKSCRLRWINYLRPDLKRGNFTQEEDDLIVKLHSMLGNKWSAIAGRLPGRTDNEIKNYWNTHIKRKLICRRIDPVTPRLLNSSPAAVVLPQPPPVVETPLITNKIDRYKTLLLESAIEENYCSSSSVTTTEEDQKPYEVQHQSDYHLDLELSIGPAPSKVQKVPNKLLDTMVPDPAYNHGRITCLSCGLHYSSIGSGVCRNCQGSAVRDGDFFGDYKQIG